ncbi:MAG TPA: sugar phosphate isomerase/epimerase family protein [Oscillospiraceae bacterium]|nr:sugar phosphate isomerase/epimerase family protein [Oscillospiraceae bacterium]
MKVSTQTLTMSRAFGDEEAIKILARVGFDALDYSMFDEDPDTSPFLSDSYESYALKLKKIAEDEEIRFNQAHAPFPSYRYGDDDYNKKILPRIIRTIAFAGILGADQIIVHPVAFKENKKEKNIELYNFLLPAAKEFGIKIALENMFGSNPHNGHLISNVCSTGKEFAEYMDALDPEYFVACLDLGHAGLVGDSAQDMIRALGHDRLKSLHVHDNNYLSDLHTLPFTVSDSKSLDWSEITAALKEIEYSGDFTFEADGFYRHMPKELLIAASEFMLKTGRYLASLCQ